MKKFENRLLITLFVLFIFGFGVMFIILPDKSFSYEENRQLQTFPDIDADSLLSGEFGDKINKYYADQFPARDQLVGVKGVCETLLLKGENNGVLLGKNGQLAVRMFDAYLDRYTTVEDIDYFYYENIDMTTRNIIDFCADSKLPVTVIIPPRTIDVASLAFMYPDEISYELQKRISDNLSGCNSFVPTFDMLKEKYDSGEYVYYKTDHHWTTYGAYCVYTELMKTWGREEEIIDQKEFNIERIEDFYGTTWSRAGYKFISPDYIEIWSLGDEDRYVSTVYDRKNILDDSGNNSVVRQEVKSFKTFYNRDYLQQKDKYSVFLDGTHSEMSVTLIDADTESVHRKRLLVAKDSFANSLVPFLARHYDIVLINLAAGMTDLSGYAEEYECDEILIIYNTQNIVENRNLAEVS